GAGVADGRVHPAAEDKGRARSGTGSPALRRRAVRVARRVSRTGPRAGGPPRQGPVSADRRYAADREAGRGAVGGGDGFAVNEAGPIQPVRFDVDSCLSCWVYRAGESLPDSSGNRN